MGTFSRGGFWQPLMIWAGLLCTCRWGSRQWEFRCMRWRIAPITSSIVFRRPSLRSFDRISTTISIWTVIRSEPMPLSPFYRTLYVLSRQVKIASNRQGACRSLKVLEFFSDFPGLERPWICGWRSLKVLEFDCLWHLAWTKKNSLSPFLCHIRHSNEPFLYADLSSLLRSCNSALLKCRISTEPL